MACDFPTGMFAEWNPFKAGNTVTPSVSYGVLADQSGNGRHALAIGALGATAAIYPSSALGFVALPDNTSNFLRWTFSSGSENLGSFTSVTFLPMAGWPNDCRFWQLRTGSRQLSLRFENTGATRSFYLQMGSTTIWSDISANIGEPPNMRPDYGVDSYAISMLRCSLPAGYVEGDTATWSVIIIADFDDGAGAQVLADASFTETVSTTGAFLTARDSWNGVETSNMGPSGGHVLWKSALNESDIRTAMIAGGCSISAAAAAAVGTLLAPAASAVPVPVTWTRRGLLGRRGVWLLELDVSGRVYRFAEEPIVVTDSRGRSLVYAEGLNGRSLSMAASTSVEWSVPVTLFADDSWGELLQRLDVMERSRARLLRIFEGQLYEEARLIIEGFVDGFGHGENNEPVSFSVQRSLRLESQLLPGSRMVADASTWPVRAGWSLDTNIEGAFYPVPIGAPGLGSVPGSEALLVETDHATLTTDRLLVAGAPVAATSVTIEDWTDEEAIEAQAATVSTEADGVGRLVAIATLDSQFTNATASGRKYFTRWSSTQLGLRGRFGAGLRGAGDVIEWLIRTWTTMRLDGAHFDAVRQQLNLYKIDTYVNDPEAASELIDDIVGMLPVEVRQGEDGIWYEPRVIQPSRALVVAELDAGRADLERKTQLKSSSRGIANEITVEYAPNAATGAYTKRVVLTSRARRDELDAQVAPTDDSRIELSYFAEVSQGRFGVRPVSIEAAHVCDPQTASRIALDVLLEQAIPRRTVRYECPPEIEAMRLGSVVAFTDTSVNVSDVLARDTDLTVGGPTVDLDLELYEDPVLATRS